MKERELPMLHVKNSEKTALMKGGRPPETSPETAARKPRDPKRRCPVRISGAMPGARVGIAPSGGKLATPRLMGGRPLLFLETPKSKSRKHMPKAPGIEVAHGKTPPRWLEKGYPSAAPRLGPSGGL